MTRFKKKPSLARHANSLPRANNVPTYSYRDSRSGRLAGLGRNIKKGEIQSPKPEQAMKAEKFSLLFMGLVILVIFISILYLSSSVEVKTIGGSASPAFLKYQPAVQKEAQRLFLSSILNGNKLTVDTSKIRSELEEDFPMYGNIAVSLPLISDHPVIDLTPANPAVLLSNADGSYLLSEAGQVMINSKSTTSFNYLKLPDVTYPVNSFLNSGEQTLTASEVQFIQTVSYELKAKGVGASSMKLPVGTAELDVYITGKPYFVKFNLQNDDPRQQAGSFLAAQHYLEGQNITPSQYIDVRVDGRVYYQ